MATLSLDLDNKWSYLKIHGDPGWESLPSYLDLVVPRILRFLRERELKITFFIVGQDAARPENAAALSAIAADGHEIANHSFHHEPWLHLYSEEEIEQEIALAEEHLERVTGQRPLGFRGPGYSLSESTLRVLARRGYLYDASTIPNVLNPLARWYYLWTTRLTDEERRRRKMLFGRLRDAFRPVKPYRWRLSGATLTELPVTTMPWFRLPIHFTYLLWLGGFAAPLARAYLWKAMTMCRVTRTAPSLLLHSLDFLGREDDPDLGFFPGMKLPAARKLALLDGFLGIVTRRYEIATLREFARRAEVVELPLLEPEFPS